jgi:hypothetical protein
MRVTLLIVTNLCANLGQAEFALYAAANFECLHGPPAPLTVRGSLTRMFIQI